MDWKFDIKSSIITIFVMPIIGVILTVIAKQFKKIVEYICSGIMYEFSVRVNLSVAARFTLKRYAQLKLKEENQYLYVPSNSEIKLEVDNIFVPLRMEKQGQVGEIYTNNDICTIANRIRIMGDPGSGKSSLIKKIFRDNCKLAIHNPSKSYFPILYEIKNLRIDRGIKTGDLGKYFLNELKESVDCSAYRTKECFDHYSEANGLLVLLDGLDEVSTSNYRKVKLAISELSKVLQKLSPNNKIILTMRTQFYQQVKSDYREEFGVGVFIKPFTPTDIYNFLTKWKFKTESNKNITRIYKDLTDRPSLREMCSNPLVLSMYVADDIARNNFLTPDTRTEFYLKVVEELLINRRVKQTGNHEGRGKLKEKRFKLLGKLAYSHMLCMEESPNSLSCDKAIRAIMDEEKCDEKTASRVFNEIAKETGLITQEREGESFRFIHLTFCEFLAAYEAIDGQEAGFEDLINFHKKFLTKKQTYSRLLEVIPFACGLTKTKDRKDVINEIIKLKNDHLLLRCFLETKLYEHEYWPKFVEQFKEKISNINNELDNEWLQQLNLFNVVIEDANQCNNIINKDNYFDLGGLYKGLLEKQRNNFEMLLTTYARQDAAAVFRIAELCNLNLIKDFSEIVTKNCDQLPFLALIIEQFSKVNEIEIKLIASLLCDSAINSKIVATELGKRTQVEELKKIIEKIPFKDRWFGTVFKENLYTQVLTIAINEEVSTHKKSKLFIYLKELTIPNSMFIFRTRKIQNIISSIISIISIFILGVFGLSFVSEEIRELNILLDPSIRNNIWTFIITLILYSFLAILSLRKFMYLQYNICINIKEVQDKQDKHGLNLILEKISEIVVKPMFLLEKVFMKKDYKVLKQIELLKENGSQLIDDIS